MNQTLTIHQLADKIVHIEKEMSVIHKELADLRRQTKKQKRITTPSVIAYPWADKGEQRRWIKELFATLSIQGVPMGAKVLQRRMGRVSLTPNELSRGLVEAREE